MAAIDLIAEEPIRFVKERITHCNGGKFWMDGWIGGWDIVY